MADTLGHVEVLVTADTAPAVASINSLKKQLGGMGTASAMASRGPIGKLGVLAAAASNKFLSASQSLNKAGRAMTSVGSTLTYSVGLPLAMLGTTAVKSANNFEMAFARIDAIAGKIGVPIDEAKEKVKELALQFGEDPQSVAEALYFIASAGVKAKDVMSVLEYSVKGAAEQLADSGTIAQLLTTVMNNYGESGMTAARGLNILTAAVTAGKAEPQELADSLGATIPMASQLGVSFESMAGAIAQGTNAGLSAARASTGLRFILGSLQRPTTMAKDVMEKYGLTVGGIQEKFKELGATGGIQYLADVFDTTTVKGKEAFAVLMGGQRGLIIANALIGENLKNAQRIDQFMKNKVDSDIAEKALDKSMNTRAQQFKKMKAQFKVFAIELGDTIVPILINDIFPVFQKIIDGFSEMSESSKKLLIWTGIFLTVLGPVLMLGGAVMRLVGGLAWIASKGIGVLARVAGAGSLLTGARAGAGVAGTGVAGVGAAGVGSIVSAVTSAVYIALIVAAVGAYMKKKKDDKVAAELGDPRKSGTVPPPSKPVDVPASVGGQGGVKLLTDWLSNSDEKWLKKRENIAYQYDDMKASDAFWLKRMISENYMTDSEAEAFAAAVSKFTEVGLDLDARVGTGNMWRRKLLDMALEMGDVTGALRLLSEWLATAVKGLQNFTVSTAGSQARSRKESGGTISPQFRYPGAEHGALIGLAGGGYLVTRPTFIRGNVITGERRKKEAVIPLEDVRGRRVLAGAMADAMGGASRGTVVVNVAGKVERPEDIRRELDWWMRSRGL